MGKGVYSLVCVSHKPRIIFNSTTIFWERGGSKPKIGIILMLAFIDRFFKLCYILGDFVKVNSVKENHFGKPKEELCPFSAFSFMPMTLFSDIFYH